MSTPVNAKEAVVLLHGLIRTPKSMEKMEAAFSRKGYDTFNLGYPSREKPIEKLATDLRREIVWKTAEYDRVHFVTHSMGGILLRYIQKEEPIHNIGRAVMLSPPSQGSELVDIFGSQKAFDWINGPAGQQLSTSPDGFIAQLGPVDFETAIITGDRSINWINSFLIEGKNDGKVSTERAKVEGMSHYKVVHATHPYIMKNNRVIAHSVHFIRYGDFIERIRSKRPHIKKISSTL